MGQSFSEFVASLEGYEPNPCPENCNDHGDPDSHAHLRTPEGHDVMAWADGRWSNFDLTLPARLIYPLRRRPAPMGGCYRAHAGFMVHVKPGCRC